MRFYLDEDLSDRVAVLLRAEGIDAVSSHECGRDGLTDAEQFHLAAGEKRCFVTRNRDDFVQITVARFEGGAPHAGLLIVPCSIPADNFSLVARILVDYAAAHPGGMETYTIDFLKLPSSGESRG